MDCGRRHLSPRARSAALRPGRIGRLPRPRAGGRGRPFVVVRRDVPEKRPIAINNRQGTTLWASLAAAGKKVAVIRMPVTFPPDEFPNGKLLAGLGVPDLSGRIGRPSYYTSDPFFRTAGRQRLFDRVEAPRLERRRGSRRRSRASGEVLRKTRTLARRRDAAHRRRGQAGLTIETSGTPGFT